MDRIQALLARAQSKVDQVSAEKKDDSTSSEPIEGPEMPPSLPSTSTRSNGSDSPSPVRSPRRGRRERSPLRDYGRHTDRSPSVSPQRKRFRGRSPRRHERSPPHGRRRDYRGGRGRDYYRDRPYRERSPSPGRLRRQEREDRDRKYHVIKEEREARTILVQGLPLDVFERQVEEFFETRKCPVRDVQLVVDKQRKFKGVAYIELYRVEDVTYAVTFSGELLEGHKLDITKADFSQTPQTSESVTASYGAGSIPAGGVSDPASIANRGVYAEPLLRLYIGNLDYGVTQDMVRDILLQFGPLESVKLQTEENGKSKGHAFAQFLYKAHALAAFHQLNTTNLAGRQIRCDFTNDARQRDPNLPPSPPMVSSRTVYYPTNGSAQSQTISLPKVAANGSGTSEALEDDFSNTTSMHSLIQRLAASTTNGSASITAANLPATAPPTENNELRALFPAQIDRSALPSPGVPSACLVLHNLFDPSTETDPNFDKEIEEDVRSEAEQFGPLVRIFVDKTSFGDVYLRFQDVSAAEGAAKLMHGRFFANRMIRAEFIPVEQFEY